MVLGIILAIIVVLVIAAIMLYNNLVKMRNMVDNAWAQIDVQLQRRCDLIPNLVETVKGYAAHESGTLEKVIAARLAVTNATTPEAKMEADNALSGTLKSLFAVSEAYPELKANANFQQLQSQLADTEDKISYMRQSFNDTVMKYNTAIAAMMSVLNEIYDKGSVTRGELMTFITLLNPFAPHLTEEINEVLGNREMLARAKWPEYDPAKCVDAAVEIAVQVSGKIKARLMIPTDSTEEAVKALVMADANVQAALAGKTVIKEIYVKGKLYNIVAK